MEPNAQSFSTIAHQLENANSISVGLLVATRRVGKHPGWTRTRTVSFIRKFERKGPNAQSFRIIATNTRDPMQLCELPFSYQLAGVGELCGGSFCLVKKNTS